MGVLADKVARRLAGVEEDLEQGIGASMREAGVTPPDFHVLAVGSRGLAERQVLVVLASAVELGN